MGASLTPDNYEIVPPINGCKDPVIVGFLSHRASGYLGWGLRSCGHLLWKNAAGLPETYGT